MRRSRGDGSWAFDFPVGFDSVVVVDSLLMATSERLREYRRFHKKELKKAKDRSENKGKYVPERDGMACPLCLRVYENPSKNSFPVWDHCHSCGTFRGWICSLCNSAEPLWERTDRYMKNLRHLLDDPEWRVRMRAYLDAHECSQSA